MSIPQKQTYTWVTPQQIKIPKHFSHIQKAGPDAINTLTNFNIAWRIVLLCFNYMHIILNKHRGFPTFNPSDLQDSVIPTTFICKVLWIPALWSTYVICRPMPDHEILCVAKHRRTLTFNPSYVQDRVITTTLTCPILWGSSLIFQSYVLCRPMPEYEVLTYVAENHYSVGLTQSKV
jgi:hypothetical protein